MYTNKHKQKKYEAQVNWTVFSVCDLKYRLGEKKLWCNYVTTCVYPQKIRIVNPQLSDSSNDSKIATPRSSSEKKVNQVKNPKLATNTQNYYTNLQKAVSK